MTTKTTALKVEVKANVVEFYVQMDQGDWVKTTEPLYRKHLREFFADHNLNKTKTPLRARY